MSARAAAICVVTSAAVAVCAACATATARPGEEPPPDGEDDPIVTGSADGGAFSECEIAHALDFVNAASTTFEALRAVGVHRIPARNVIAHRDGPDGRSGTGDDDPFDDIRELDAVPYVGPVMLRRIVDSSEPSCTGVAEACVPSGLPGTRPVAIGPAIGIDLMAAGFPDERGGAWIVYEHFDEAFTESRLFIAHVDAALRLDSTAPLEVGSETFVAAPSAVETGSRRYVYFETAGDLRTRPSLYRSALDGGAPAAREAVGPIRGVDWLLSWPRFHALSEGRVVAAFLDGSGWPSVAISEDGVTFGGPIAVDSAPRALVHIGSFPDDTLVLTYQTGRTPMISYARIAADPRVWSAPIRVTSASDNVHDTTTIARLDGAIDLYYIYPAGPVGFSVHRRPLARDGSLGPEARVTDDYAGDATKPQVVRLSDCRLLLLYAEITERATDGSPVQQRLGAQILDADARR